jgi:hypothetical protein
MNCKAVNQWYIPSVRYLAQRRVYVEVRSFEGRGAESTGLVYTTCQEVVEKSLLHLLQLRDGLLGAGDGVVEGVEDGSDMALIS